MAGAHLAGQDIADHASGDKAGDLSCVVGRRALHDLNSGYRLAVRDDLKELQHFAWQEPTWFRPAGSRDEGGVQTIHIEAQPDRVGAVPRHLERTFSGILNPHLHAIGDSHDGGLAFTPDLHTGPWRLPAADSDLHEICCRHVGNVRRVKPGCGVHALVEIGVLRVYMPVEVNDAELAAMEMLGNASHSRKAKGMVAAEHHGKRSAGVHVRDGLTDLIERLFDVAGNGKHVAEITHGNGLPQIHAELEAIRSIQSRDLANALRAKPRAGPIRRATIKRRPKNSHVVLAALAYVFHVGRFDKRVNPSEVG